jgi:hypothetical protein
MLSFLVRETLFVQRLGGASNQIEHILLETYYFLTGYHFSALLASSEPIMTPSSNLKGMKKRWEEEEERKSSSASIMHRIKISDFKHADDR